jgi:hypothetical protein
MYLILLLIICITIFFILSPRRENLKYLDVYEKQDYYQNYPQVWPIPYTYTTALYKLRRELNQKIDGDRHC